MPENGSARRLRWPTLITIVSAAILIGTELLGAAYACGWAVAHQFGLGDTVAQGLQVVLSVLALFIIYKFVRLANKAEPIYA